MCEVFIPAQTQTDRRQKSAQTEFILDKPAYLASTLNKLDHLGFSRQEANCSATFGSVGCLSLLVLISFSNSPADRGASVGFGSRPVPQKCHLLVNLDNLSLFGHVGRP
ncbi:hypothetical protein BaRGS_00006425 [Batillaria attramentaria]|uniref:Uncharacterized protein n=1 Tax=Batillaria attramentaria TaxID=370345 RepID=A0ABD0LSP5_9CAEN